MADPANTENIATVGEAAAGNKSGPGVLLETPDELLAEVRNLANPFEWRCRCFLALNDALVAARTRGELFFTLTAARDDGRNVTFLTTEPEMVALALVMTPQPNRAARRAQRRERAS